MLNAGTCDLIAAFPDRKVRMIDVKTGGIYPEVGLQLEAYRRCEYLFPRVTGDPAHPVAMPPVSETDVLAKPALIHWAAKTAATLVLEDPEKYSTTTDVIAIRNTPLLVAFSDASIAYSGASSQGVEGDAL